MQTKIPAVYMRGGSSKGLYFHENHLPRDPFIRDKVILAAYGSPDPNKRQIDGMGGATSVTSKVAIVSPSNQPDLDVNYLFGQVSIDRPIIDYKGNCGNILSGIGPFAIEEGLVKAVEPFTEVRIYQVNTQKVIVAEVPVENGQPRLEGDFMVDGVPGSGAKITLRFLDPGGSVTGKLIPTGNMKDVIEVPGKGSYTVSIIDAANPLVFINAEDLGLKGTEIDEIDASNEIRGTLEAIRSRAAALLGIAETPEEATAKSQAVPKIAMVSSPQDYEAVTGKVIEASAIDLVGRTMSMGTLHKSYALTGAICTCGAACIEGTVVNEVVRKEALVSKEVRLGHPSGILPIEPNIEYNEGEYNYIDGGAGRTARRLMEGYVYVEDKHFR